MSIEKMQATQHIDLIERLLNPCIPKTELEHAAAKEIEKLRTAIEQAENEYERGVEAGKKQERAMWELAKIGQEIEQVEKQEIEPDKDWVENDGCPTEKSVLQRFWREHQQAEKQAPVVWMYQDKNTHQVRFQKHMSDFVDHSAIYETPLYTAPPQREWVGLTDEERYLNDSRTSEEIEYARAIEAKLKEKNI